MICWIKRVLELEKNKSILGIIGIIVIAIGLGLAVAN